MPRHLMPAKSSARWILRILPDSDENNNNGGGGHYDYRARSSTIDRIGFVSCRRQSTTSYDKLVTREIMGCKQC